MGRHTSTLERLAEPLDRGAARAVAPGPRLGLADERAELGEHELGRSVGAVEPLDPVEPAQDGARFLHVSNVPAQHARVCADFVPKV